MAKTFFTLAFLVTLFAGAAEAGQKVLVLQSVDVAPYEQAVKGFQQVSGSEVKRIFIADLKERDLLKTVREEGPDLVLAVGRDALLSARQVTAVPVVYCMVASPPSFLAGERNVSGVSMKLPPERQLTELLKMIPAVREIGLLYDPGQTGAFVQGLRKAAAGMNVHLTATAVRRPGEVPSLLKAMQGKVNLFWMLPDITVITPETTESLILFSLENKVPILTFSEKYLELGAMIAIGIDPFDIGAQAGEMAQKILSGGNARNGQHVDARKTLVSINLQIARKLGVSLDRKVMRDVKVVR